MDLTQAEKGPVWFRQKTNRTRRAELESGHGNYLIEAQKPPAYVNTQDIKLFLTIKKTTILILI